MKEDILKIAKTIIAQATFHEFDWEKDTVVAVKCHHCLEKSAIDYGEPEIGHDETCAVLAARRVVNYLTEGGENEIKIKPSASYKDRAVGEVIRKIKKTACAYADQQRREEEDYKARQER